MALSINIVLLIFITFHSPKALFFTFQFSFKISDFAIFHFSIFNFHFQLKIGNFDFVQTPRTQHNQVNLLLRSLNRCFQLNHHPLAPPPPPPPPEEPPPLLPESQSEEPDDDSGVDAVVTDLSIPDRKPGAKISDI